jgi:predicted nucleic acid-binding protein
LGFGIIVSNQGKSMQIQAVIPDKKLRLYTSQPKTVELLERIAGGLLATKAPLSGQKTQILISVCGNCFGSK